MNREKSFIFQLSRFVIFAGGMMVSLLFGGQAALAASMPTTDQQILSLEGEIAKAPESIPLRNRLASAYLQKGRETGDAAYFTRAERLLDKLLSQAANNGEALGLRAWVALFKHEFKEAAAWAEKAHAAQPKNSFHDGVLSDASLELGDYPKAIDYAQTMLDLKQDQGAYSRAAHLRSLHGDIDGTIDLWRKAIRSGSPHSEHTAWCQVEWGDEYFNIGKEKEAEAAYRAALKTFPGYHRALAGLARLKATEDQKTEAAQLYQQAIAVIPYPQYISALGDLYAQMGKAEEARKQYALVEQIALLDRINHLLYNRELALFYADHDRNLDEALRLIEREAAVRKDIYTEDALGWVYYKNGRYQEADRAMQEALRLGTKNPLLFYHAGMIARALGKEKEARRLLKEALALNPHFHPIYQQSARETLTALTTSKGGRS